MKMHNLRPAEWCVIVGPYTRRHHHPTDLSTPDRSASPGILLEAFCRLWPFLEMVPHAVFSKLSCGIRKFLMLERTTRLAIEQGFQSDPASPSIVTSSL
jgi:hypothetical protein